MDGDSCFVELEMLYFRDGPQVGTFLQKALQSCPTLRTIRLDGTVLDRVAYEAIVERMERNALESLKISRHSMDFNSGLLLAEGIARCSSLRVLDLEMTHLGDVVAGAILESILKAKALKELNLNSNNISSKSIVPIVQLVGELGLERLELENNFRLMENQSLDPRLQKALTENRSLRTLNLNGMSTPSRQFFTSLMHHPQLEMLKIGRNPLPDTDANEVEVFLTTNTHLKHLDLSDNSIGDAGLKAICKGLEKNSTLETLILQGIKAGDNSVVAMKSMLFANRSLQKLVISDFRDENGGVGVEGIRAIFEGLIHNTSLRILRLEKGSGTQCTGAPGWSDQSELLACVLNTNKSLHELYFAGRQLESFGRAVVAELTEECVIQVLKFGADEVDNCQKLRYLTNMNQVGQMVLRRVPPLSLWPRIFTTKKTNEADAIFYLLRQNPALIGQLKPQTSQQNQKL